MPEAGTNLPLSQPPRPAFLRRLAKVFAILATLVLIGIATLLASLWIEHKTNITLPTPTGPCAVGREIEAWADGAHSDTLAPVPGTKRELMVWIWYPAAGASPAVMADYMPADWRAADRLPAIFRLLTRDLSKVHAHSIRDSDVSSQQVPYPVVIMRGGASANVVFYTTLAEDLASHGYVVVGFDAPYRSNVVVFPDGRVMRRQQENNPELCVGRPDQESCASRILNAWTSDIAFVLDRLTQLNAAPSGKFARRLDMTRVGVFGHSFGGAAAALFCRQDSRCRAAIDIDGAPHGDVIQAGIHHPFMFLMSDHGRESDPEAAQIMANIQSIYDRLPPDSRSLVAIRGANHFLFSDDGALLKSHMVLAILRALGVLAVEGRRQLAVTTYCVHSFFDAYLKAPTVSPLMLSSAQYPEIQILP